MGPVRYEDTHLYPEDDPYSRMESITSETTSEASSFTWTWQETLLSIPLGLIVLGTILGNFLVLYAVATRSHTLRLPTHFFIANLAVADFLVGVFVMPFLATLQVTGRWYFGQTYCETWIIIHFWLCSASILSTCAVCIERYIGVRFPLNHKEIMNQRRIWGLTLCVWVSAGLLTFASLYIWYQPQSGEPYSCGINQRIGHVLIAVVGILYIPAIIMIVLYWQIYCIASKHLNLMKNNTSSSGLSSGKVLAISAETSLSTSNPTSSTEYLDQQHHGAKKASAVSNVSSSSSSAASSASSNWNVSLVKNVEKKKQINLAKRLCFLVGILLASYLPFFTLYLVMAFKPGSVNIRVFNGFGWIRYFNSCLNPVIYAFAVPAYRKAIKEIAHNIFGKLQRAPKL